MDQKNHNDNLVTFDNWGFIYPALSKLADLSNLALKEDWFYGSRDPQTYPILRNYLYFTYKRLETERKILESTAIAAFDTGLVDIKYDSIYAIFHRTTPKGDKIPTHKWILEAFATASHRHFGRTLLDNFNPLPLRANYFENVSEKVFDTSQSYIQLSDDHIIIDNIERYPLEFVKRNLSYNIKQPTAEEICNYELRADYYNYLKKALVHESQLTSVVNMRNRLQDAIEIAIKRTVWNFKTAIPMYYPFRSKMTLLLPLSLVRDNIVDIALVVEKMGSGAYRGNTVFPLQWAYINARLITRPDSDWLIAKQITFNERSENAI